MIWKKYRSFVLSALLACAVGAFAGLLSSGGILRFEQVVRKPPLTPAPAVFPVVWTALYLLMGIGAAFVSQAPPGENRRRALRLYALQLAVNFFWSILFFQLSAYLAALLWLALLWLLIVLMIRAFFPVSPTAGLLQVPYLLWVSFAGYLNWGVWTLNR